MRIPEIPNLALSAPVLAADCAMYAVAPKETVP